MTRAIITDLDGTILPRKGEIMETSTAHAPVLNRLLTIKEKSAPPPGRLLSLPANRDVNESLPQAVIFTLP